MCSHDWITVNDVKACKRCGLVIMHDGKVFFDRQFPNRKKRKRKLKNGEWRK